MQVHVVKGPGSEPKLSKYIGEETSLYWGNWCFTAEVRLIMWCGALHFVGVVGVSGSNDNGEGGMTGELMTSPQATLDDVAREVRTTLRMTVRSLHCEEDDEDWALYERTIDLGPAIDVACKQVRDSLAEGPVTP